MNYIDRLTELGTLTNEVIVAMNTWETINSMSSTTFWAYMAERVSPEGQIHYATWPQILGWGCIRDRQATPIEIEEVDQ